jgi:hypothetical protein
VVQLGLVDSAWQCTEAHCCFSAAVFGCQKCSLLFQPSLPTWFNPLQFILIQGIKLLVWGCHLQDVAEIQECLLAVLHAVSKGQFQWCFKQWLKQCTYSMNLDWDHVHRQGRQRWVTKICLYFIISPINGLFDMPSCILWNTEDWVIHVMLP